MLDKVLKKLYQIRHNEPEVLIQEPSMVKELDTKSAAERWGVSEVYIRRLLREGRVKGHKVRRDWLVDSKSLLDYMKGNRKRGPKGHNHL